MSCSSVPQPRLVLGHTSQHVAVYGVEVVMVRHIMSDNFCIDYVALTLLAGLIQSLVQRVALKILIFKHTHTHTQKKNSTEEKSSPYEHLT